MWLRELGRWQCRLIGNDEVCNLKPRNVVPGACRLSPGASVTLQGLSKAELNGKRAELQEWRHDSGRWQCRLVDSEDVCNFKPRNIVADAGPVSEVDVSKQEFEGQCVVVQGLTKQPELNGLPAEALEWREQMGRYRCQLIGADIAVDFNFKRANLALSSAPPPKRPRLN